MRSLVRGRGGMMPDPVIYHGTPLTPRDALLSVLRGRGACVSFYRPDDLEAVEAVSPLIMFRSWRVFRLARGFASRRGMESSGARSPSLLRVVGATPIPAGPLGRRLRCARGPIAVQRRLLERLAVWTVEGCAGLAHERPSRSARETAGAVRSDLPRL